MAFSIRRSRLDDEEIVDTAVRFDLLDRKIRAPVPAGSGTMARILQQHGRQGKLGALSPRSSNALALELKQLKGKDFDRESVASAEPTRRPDPGTAAKASALRRDVNNWSSQMMVSGSG